MPEKIRVKAAPLADPALAGKARVRKLEQSDRWFTEKEELVERTPQIERMLLAGDLVAVTDRKKTSRKAEGE